jgi:hypothetical protein
MHRGRAGLGTDELQMYADTDDGNASTGPTQWTL